MLLTLAWIAAAIAALLVTGYLYERRSRRYDDDRYPPLGRMIDVGGHRLHLLTKGSAGPTVVIEQGAGGPSLAWSPIQEELAQLTRVCLYDRAGYFPSDAVAGRRSLEDRVRDLHAALTLGEVPGPFVLVAHSYGGFLIRLFARTYPGSVAGMVLVDTPHESSYFRPEVLALYSKVAWMMRAVGFLSRFGLPRLLSRWFSKAEPPLPLDLQDRIGAAMVRREYCQASVDDVGSLQRAAAWLREPNALGSLADMPIGIISHGQPFPGPFAVLEGSWHAGQEKLSALSTQTLWVTAQQANHMIQNDDPRIVIDVIRRIVEAARTGTPLHSASDVTGRQSLTK